ncbi:HNH endonuclease [Bradyrhizobium diazoefficiens]|nr:HNH endonuclease [Bradyrhizobium diazoefficiens]QQO20538.1 HNH endonuclease [Bradyrhizobium diazoefficiens]
MSPKIMLCRLVWAEEYKSKDEPIFAGNMRYPAAHDLALERLNFADDNGTVRGFVENRGQNFDLRKLGAKESDDSIPGVTIIFCAVDEPSRKLRVVGWYENATVYHEPKKPKKGSLRGNWDYYFEASSKDAHLIPGTARDLVVPRKSRITDKGFIGQRCVFYPAGNPNYERFLQSFDLLRQDALPDGEGDTDQTEFQEGQRASRETKYFARNPKLVRAAKTHYGTSCLACGFNFAEFYGDIGTDFIEVHHKRQMADDKARLKTVADVDVLCANCHRMVHKRAVPLTLAELKALIREQQKPRKRA